MLWTWLLPTYKQNLRDCTRHTYHPDNRQVVVSVDWACNTWSPLSIFNCFAAMGHRWLPNLSLILVSNQYTGDLISKKLRWREGLVFVVVFTPRCIMRYLIKRIVVSFDPAMVEVGWLAQCVSHHIIVHALISPYQMVLGLMPSMITWLCGLNKGYFSLYFSLIGSHIVRAVL